MLHKPFFITNLLSSFSDSELIGSTKISSKKDSYFLEKKLSELNPPELQHQERQFSYHLKIFLKKVKNYAIITKIALLKKIYDSSVYF